MRHSLFPILLISLLLTGGCVRGQRYRQIWNQPGCFDGQTDPVRPQGANLPPAASLDCRSSLYKVGFIEFDDQGRPLDPLQEKKVLDLIRFEKQRAAPGGGKIITLIYVHGWKNNAAQAAAGSPAKDVERFRRALSELGARASKTTNGSASVPVVGVYIGWRGKSLSGPSWFTFLSYWGRRNAANRVGDTNLPSVLNNIIDATNQASSTSRVLLLGHSFGARALEHAIETRAVPLLSGGPGAFTPRVDLTLYVNSANDARLSLKRIQDLKTQPVVVRHPDFDAAICNQFSLRPENEKDKLHAICSPYPLLVAVTSRGDNVTKFLLPPASFIPPRDHLAPTSLPSPLDPQTSSSLYLGPIPPAAIYQRSAAGHLRFLHSHDVTEVKCPASGTPPRCPAGDLTCAFAFETYGESATCYEASVRQPLVSGKPPLPYNNTAFWVMAVDPPVIQDHGDIWNLSFINMLGQVMSPRGFFEPGAKRVQIR